MAYFFEKYIFHWTPEKAIYLDGFSLLWDARCAGIYSGFGFGLIFHLFGGWRNKNLPSFNIVVFNTLMFLPMFFDILTLWLELRKPSNDIRFLTGIFFGGAFCIWLYPAFISLFSQSKYKTTIKSFTHYICFLSLCLTTFILKYIDNIVSFIFLMLLSCLGFVGIFIIFLVYFIKKLNFRQK